MSDDDQLAAAGMRIGFLESEIEKLQAERTVLSNRLAAEEDAVAELRGLLETAVDCWEAGHWNSRIGMQQLHLSWAWLDEAKKA